MGRSKVRRRPCDIEAIYYAKTLALHASDALEKPFMEKCTNHSVFVTITEIWQLAENVYGLLSRANSEKETECKLNYLKSAMGDLDELEARLDILYTTYPKAIKSTKYWVQLIYDIRKSTARWDKAIRCPKPIKINKTSQKVDIMNPSEQTIL